MNRFERHPRATLAGLIGAAIVVLLVGAEHVLRRIDEAESRPRDAPAAPARFIRLREHRPLRDRTYVPSDDYMIGTEGLVQKPYRVRSDADGFLVPSQPHREPDLTILFLGGSATECMYMAEEKRFPARVGVLLQQRHGLKVNAVNAGVSGSHSLHSIDVLLNKGFRLGPDVVVLNHNINDLIVLSYFGSYWNDSPYRSLVVRHTVVPERGPPSAGAAVKALARAVFPRLYLRLFRLRRGPDRPSAERPVVAPDEFADVRGSRITVDRPRAARAFRASLVTFVALCRAHEVTPVLVTQANRLGSVPESKILEDLHNVWSFGITYADFKAGFDDLNQAIRDVARDHSVLCVDLARLVPQNKEYMYDTVHFTEAGSERVARMVSQALSEIAVARAASFPTAAVP